MFARPKRNSTNSPEFIFFNRIRQRKIKGADNYVTEMSQTVTKISYLPQINSSGFFNDQFL